MNTDNKNKFLLGLALVFFIAMVIIVVLSFKNIPKEKEPFAQNPSSGNKFLTSDINGNLSLYTTNNDSIIVTDSKGVMKNLPFPKGLIMIWHNNGTTNPTNDDLAPGWSLCDGNTYNGYTTPDLRGRFVLGAGSGTGLTPRTVGTGVSGPHIGGAETHTLNIDEIPSHSHSLDLGSACSFSSCGSGRNTTMWGGGVNTNASGGGRPHNNMPPFYVLCYICYTGDRL